MKLYFLALCKSYLENRVKKLIMTIESHPLEPFLPQNGRILMLGSFPPPKERWSMDFFYPNKINDMWRIIGLVFFGERDRFVAQNGGFDKESIVKFCNEKGIALYDTACEVRRLNNDASDKFLEVVRQSDIAGMLEKMPNCKAIVVTGQKALDTLMEKYGEKQKSPSVGKHIEITLAGRKIRLYRMPSSSRAYPLKLEKKAEYYDAMFKNEGLV